MDRIDRANVHGPTVAPRLRAPVDYMIETFFHRSEKVTANDQAEKLAVLGWGPRHDPTILLPPGVVRDISIKSQGDTWVVLDWKPPADGGAPAAYQIQRRKPGEDWEHLATSVDTEELVSDQERGMELQFRVYAVNRSGEGKPSALAAVVL